MRSAAVSIVTKATKSRISDGRGSRSVHAVAAIVLSSTCSTSGRAHLSRHSVSLPSFDEPETAIFRATSSRSSPYSISSYSDFQAHFSPCFSRR